MGVSSTGRRGGEEEEGGAATLKPWEANAVRTRGTDNTLVFVSVYEPWTAYMILIVVVIVQTISSSSCHGDVGAHYKNF